MAKRFDSSELSNQYIALLEDVNNRDALVKKIYMFCKKFSKHSGVLPSAPDIDAFVTFVIKSELAYRLAIVFVRVLSLLTTGKRKLGDDDVHAMLKMLV